MSGSHPPPSATVATQQYPPHATSLKTVHRTVFLTILTLSGFESLFDFVHQIKKHLRLLKCFLFGGEQGISVRHCRAYRLASLVATSAKTVHRTVFFRILRMLPPCSNSFTATTFKSKKHLYQNKCFLWRRARDSNPRSRFSDLHDFQSCSFDQLGQLSIYLIALTLYTRWHKKSSLFAIKFNLRSHISDRQVSDRHLQYV